MRKAMFAIAGLAICGVVAAQTFDEFHVFRNDNNFKTHKMGGSQSIRFEGADGEFRSMIVTDEDGTETTHPMSAIDSCVFRSYGIPEFHVTLTDYPDWTELQGKKDDVRAATIYMLGNGMYDDLKEQTVEFRGRGNSTWNMPKKPYRFKMAKKASVCGLPKAKTFALIANWIDCTLMRNAIALWFANYLNMPYSNHAVPCKVYLNGIYKGAYMLTEKIGIGGGSVDIDETTGMLFELDSNYDENYKFMYSWTKSSGTSSGRPGGGGWSNSNSYEIPVMVKDPDLDELAADTAVTNITNAQQYFSLWQADFTKMADAVTSRATTESLSDVIDVESAVNFFLVNGLSNNHEMKHPKSFYIHKKSLDEGEVYHFGPVWDFDWSFTFNGAEGASPEEMMIESESGDKDGGVFIKALCANEEFRALYKQKLEDFYTTGYPEMKKFMEEYATLIEPSAKDNGLLWPSHYYASWCIMTSCYDFRNNFETLKEWIDTRLTFMRNHKNFGLYE